MSWYLKVLRNYTTTTGRAGRREFWMFVLVNALVIVALHLIDRVTGLTYGTRGQGFLQSFYAMLVFLPGIAVAVRRLHDIGKSGWFLLVAFIPFIGGIVLLSWYIKEGDPKDNAYGAKSEPST